jgi:PLP dependent protein
VPALVDALGALGLDVAGLMTVAPLEGEPVRWFAALGALADSLGLPERSMGMSGDFEAAIAEGATMVRVGTALFGTRPRP